MTAAMIREAFAHTPPLWWPVLVLSILALHGEMARAAAAGFTHGQIRLLAHGRLVLDLVPPVPALPDNSRPAPNRLALNRALSGDTSDRPPGIAAAPSSCRPVGRIIAGLCALRRPAAPAATRWLADTS